MAELRTRKGSVARALEFTILTAARTSEATGARRSEFKLDHAMWIVPAERMKAGKKHRVPLSPRALEIVRGELAASDSDLVFNLGPKHRPLSRSAMARIMERGKRRDGELVGTVHGFRSTFRDWAGDCTHFPRDVCEAALAHGVENEVEAAYRRGDAFEKRRLLMTAWSEYCAGQTPANVLPFVRAA
jgi:integrase